MNNYCKVCENKTNNSLIAAKNMRAKSREVFDYVCCNKCQSLSIKEIPNNLKDFYDNYYSFRPIIQNGSYLCKKIKKYIISNNNFISHFFSFFLKDISNLPLKIFNKIGVNKDSHILDVGCGSGQLVYDLQEAGYKNAFGLDPYLESNIINYSNGAKIFKKSIYEEDKQWDLIMMNHVFEHMDDSLEILKKINKLLKPQGTVLIRIPNSSSYAFRKFKENWFGIQAPIHIILPSYEGMKILTEKTDFKISNVVGENLLDLWLLSFSYTLNIWHYDDLGILPVLEKRDLRLSHPLFSKADISYWKCLNEHILKTPILCDWIAYFIKKKN